MDHRQRSWRVNHRAVRPMARCRSRLAERRRKGRRARALFCRRNRSRHCPALLRRPARRLGIFHILPGSGAAEPWPKAWCNRSSDDVGHDRDGAKRADHRRGRRDARRQPDRPHPFNLFHRDHRHAGIRLGRRLRRPPRLTGHRPFPAPRTMGLDRRQDPFPGRRFARQHHLLELHPSSDDNRALRHWLHRPDDPRLDDRGDDRAIHPHRPAARVSASTRSSCATRCGTR